MQVRAALRTDGPAGPFRGTRDRRALRRRSARAHSGAQAQAWPLRRANFWGSRCGRRQPPRGQRAAGPRARPALSRRRLTYLRPPQAWSRRTRGNGGSAANTPRVSIRGDVYPQVSRDHAAEGDGSDDPACSARPRPACALLTARHRSERLCSDLATFCGLGAGPGGGGARGGAKPRSLGIYVGKPCFLNFFRLSGLGRDGALLHERSGPAPIQSIYSQLLPWPQLLRGPLMAQLIPAARWGHLHLEKQEGHL